MLDSFRKIFLTKKNENAMLPPKKLREHVGDGDFELLGNIYLEFFKTIGELKPDMNVLDIGCGSGRMAIPLTKYLDKNSKYEGFDVSKECIAWCKENITSRYPNFMFQHVDIFNTFYNPNGTIKPENFKFPYDSDSFDFIYLTSIFTHMLPDDMEQYFSEITRVLKKGGRCFITYFIINQESLECIRQGKSSITFFLIKDGFYSTAKDIPERVIAYHEEFLRKLYTKYGLTLNEPIHFAKWCGREEGINGQDIIIANK